MQIVQLLGLFALIVAVAGEVCENCSFDDLLIANVTTRLEIPGKNVDSVDTPPPHPSRPPTQPTRPPPGVHPASDELWNRCRNKGCTLTWAMGALDSDVGPYYSPGRQTAASPYQSTNDLIKWFWFTFPFERISAGFRDFYGSWGIGWALDALGVSPYSDEYEGGKNQVFALDHADPNQDVENQWYNADGKNYRATGASHSFSVNWEEGVIMGMNRKSPRNAAEERKPPVPNDLLPGLNQFSDVAWIIWEGLVKRNNGDVKNLRYFISLGIDNADTKAILTRAINGKPGEYPGLTFDAQSQEGKAIMGTPNVQGFAYFLIQHKQQLGNMFISKLQVFHGETAHENPCIIMHISQPSTQTSEVERRDVGGNIVRVHTVRAML